MADIPQCLFNCNSAKESTHEIYVLHTDNLETECRRLCKENSIYIIGYTHYKNKKKEYVGILLENYNMADLLRSVLIDNDYSVTIPRFTL
jgi:hypothetical protein